MFVGGGGDAEASERTSEEKLGGYGLTLCCAPQAAASSVRESGADRKCASKREKAKVTFLVQ